MKCQIGARIQLEKGLAGFNFATTIQVTRQLVVTVWVGAQGRPMAVATRTLCGVVTFAVRPTLTITTCIVAVGVRITITARALIRCAVSQNYSGLFRHNTPNCTLKIENNKFCHAELVSASY